MRAMPKYHSVNGAWPEGTNDGRDLKPTAQEAMSAAKRLYRFAFKRAFGGRVKLTKGRNYTSIRRGILYVNPDQGNTWSSHRGGWHEIVHGMSHYACSRLYPNAKGHGPQHSFLEREMIQLVVDSGWLEGKLKRADKPSKDIKTVRAERLAAQIAAWEAKERRARNALKRLRPKLARYARIGVPSIEEQTHLSS